MARGCCLCQSSCQSAGTGAGVWCSSGGTVEGSRSERQQRHNPSDARNARTCTQQSLCGVLPTHAHNCVVGTRASPPARCVGGRPTCVEPCETNLLTCRWRRVPVVTWKKPHNCNENYGVANCNRQRRRAHIMAAWCGTSCSNVVAALKFVSIAICRGLQCCKHQVATNVAALPPRLKQSKQHGGYTLSPVYSTNPPPDDATEMTASWVGLAVGATAEPSVPSTFTTVRFLP